MKLGYLLKLRERNETFHHNFLNRFSELDGLTRSNEKILNYIYDAKDCTRSYYICPCCNQAFFKNFRCENKHYCYRCHFYYGFSRLIHFWGLIDEQLQKGKTVCHCVISFRNCFEYIRDTRKRHSQILGHLRRLSVFSNCLGGIWSYEISYNQKFQTFHPHYHCLLVLPPNRFVKKFKLSAAMYNYTNGQHYYSYLTKLKHESQLRDLFNYVTKPFNFVTKVNDVYTLLGYYKAIYKQRFFGSWGLFYGTLKELDEKRKEMYNNIKDEPQNICKKCDIEMEEKK